MEHVQLAKGLRARGHEVIVVRPRVGSKPGGEALDEYDRFEPLVFRGWAPSVPFVRNYFKNERFYAAFATFLADFIRQSPFDIVHAQHVLTGPPSITAARAANVPVVCTVRDYWPVCYWSDLILDPHSDTLCPACSAGRMTECIRPHGGALWPLAIPVIPYMRANLSLKRRSLAAADAVVAVSSAIAADLTQRAPELASTRIEMIHNPVDTAGIRAQAEAAARPMADTYALFVGKLEANKGVSKLMTAIERAGLDWPLVVVGDGHERADLEAAARRAGRDVRFVGWRAREETLAWMRHAGLLVFPSHGPESLSRVLLEASTLGVAIAAMETGGTADIIEHEGTGLLSRSAEGLGDDVKRLRNDRPLRERLGQAARQRIERRFDSTVVIAQIDALYGELIRQRSAVK